ncbi:helix-turn-helix domain-containing protein [Pseudomonas oryzihabitans]|jgi:cytoskeleton protein RodZ|uniref:RodZ domain-containing protein n=1 Tax=Pseudomonas oryzihabitans TaxID=47885 RepID=UPI0021D83158|nr:helix-turn-helix domain-containing protein [Pseudomonas oryzihabitans]MDK8265907.1 helix-turn-helix domain-containing protein [Pseudomonas oryzihabitans]
MTAVQSEAVHAGRGNPGEILRQKRLALGWSQAQVAQNLNLSERIIEQLESGNYQQMPGHTFARGYTKAYGKLLGLDQVELVRTFDGYTGTDAKGSTVHSLGRLDEPVRLSRNVLRFVSFILVVLIIAMGLFWWQERSRQASSASAVSMEHVEVEGADGKTEIHPIDEPEEQPPATAQQPATTVPSPVGTPMPDANAVAAMTAPSAAPTPAPVTGSTTPAPTAPTVAAPAAPASAPAAAPVAGNDSLNIRFTASCWTQVSDGTGKILFSGVKKGGESLDYASIKAPVNIRLGFARGAQISYNGQVVDLAPYTKGETARIKLGQAGQ